MEKNKREEGLRRSMNHSEQEKEVFILLLKAEQDWVGDKSFTVFISRAGAIG